MIKLKKILKSPVVITLCSWILGLYLRTLYFTIRWRLEVAPETQNLLYSDKPFLAVLWHGRLLMPAQLLPSTRKAHAVISQHSDGDLITNVLRFIKIYPIRGSSRKGGRRALVDALATLKKPHSIVAITPDGPIGPRRKILSNVLSIAHKTNVAIVPTAYAAFPNRVFQSWDRFMLPKLFGRGVLLFGAPIFVPSIENENELRLALEKSLNAVTAEADRMVGMDPTVTL